MTDASANAAGTTGRAAAFFDVDGTLVHSTIAHYYAYFRRVGMPAWLGKLWHASFVARCGYFLILDKINRSMMNRVFYRSYKGMSVSGTRDLCEQCYQEVIRPRLYLEGEAEVKQHNDAGREVVLVTGSIDFVIEPLARELGIASVVASRLLESGDVFTGELAGPPIGEEEKARRMRIFAEDKKFDLEASYGYGDSIADLPMLEAVGHPVAVNPDKKLAAIAAQRGWPVKRWSQQHPTHGVSN
ncbi:MAG: HAD family hydrolase [Phycisphaerae bacterium]